MKLSTESARKFNSELKKAVQNLIGQKVSVEIINSYNFPRCRVRIFPAEKNFSNEFRLQVFDACGFERKHLLNDTDISYGNIQSNRVSASVQEWQKMFETL